MAETGWTFEELLTNGWFPHWNVGTPGSEGYSLRFTYYRSEISIDAVTGQGESEEAAQADAARNASAWLREHPQYQPKRPGTVAGIGKRNAQRPANP